MATADELFEQMEENPEEFIEPVNDVLVINPETRIINVPASERLFGVLEDQNSERKYFKCPKIVGDNIDLSKHRIFIKYIQALDKDGTKFVEETPEIRLCEDVAVDGDYITFSWKLSGNVYKKDGFIAFSVVAIDGESVTWNTKPSIGVVAPTIPGGLEEIAELYPDIINQLLDKMGNVEKIATPEAMQEYVNTWCNENTPLVDETLTDDTKAAPAGVVGELKSDLEQLKEYVVDGESNLCIGDTEPTNGVMYWLDTSDDVSSNGTGEEPDTNPEVTLLSISVEYTGGDVIVGTTLTSLTGIIVTGTYSDGSKSEITGYALSGEITEGENTITVTYSELICTFTVIGYVEEDANLVESNIILTKTDGKEQELNSETITSQEKIYYYNYNDVTYVNPSIQLSARFTSSYGYINIAKNTSVEINDGASDVITKCYDHRADGGYVVWEIDVVAMLAKLQSLTESGELDSSKGTPHALLYSTNGHLLYGYEE